MNKCVKGCRYTVTEGTTLGKHKNIHFSKGDEVIALENSNIPFCILSKYYDKELNKDDLDFFELRKNKKYYDKIHVISSNCLKKKEEYNTKESNKMYKIIITVDKDNRMVESYRTDTKVKGVAKCSYDDEFDDKYGVNLAVERMFNNVESKEDKEIKIGDTVEIIDDGEMYSTAENFLYDSNIDFYLIKKYAKGESSFRNGRYLMHKKGKVVGFIKNFSNLIYIIINDKGYIINKFGVKKV